MAEIRELNFPLHCHKKVQGAANCMNGAARWSSAFCLHRKTVGSYGKSAVHGKTVVSLE